MNLLHVQNWVPGPRLLTHDECKAYGDNLKGDDRYLFYGSTPLVRSMKMGAAVGVLGGLVTIPQLVSFEWATAPKDLMQADILHTLLGRAEQIATPVRCCWRPVGRIARSCFRNNGRWSTGARECFAS